MRRSGKALILAGILLIALSVGILLTDHLQAKNAEEEAAEILAQLDRILPQYRVGVPEYYSNMQMPALQVGQQDVIAILEIPAFGIRLPVCGSWESKTAFPKRFSGSVYDDSLVLGGSDQLGQFDCFDKIQDGAEITITDMTGAVFTYSLSRVQRSDSADARILLAEEYDLTLFTRDAHTMEYLLLRCAR